MAYILDIARKGEERERRRREQRLLCLATPRCSADAVDEILAALNTKGKRLKWLASQFNAWKAHFPALCAKHTGLLRHGVFKNKDYKQKGELLKMVITSQTSEDSPPSLERKLSVQDHVEAAAQTPDLEPDVFWVRCEASRNRVVCNKWRQLEAECTGRGNFMCKRVEGATCAEPCDECECAVCVSRNETAQVNLIFSQFRVKNKETLGYE